MRNKFPVFSLLCIILYFCSCDRNQAPVDFPNTAFAESDTTQINKIILKISQNEYQSADSAFKYIELARELSKNCNYDEGLVESLYLRGNLLYSENRLEDAMDSYSAALELSENLKSPLLKAKCMERIASVNLTLGDDHLALKLYYEALALFEQTGNKEGIAKVYNIIGIRKSSEGKYDSAACYFQRAIQLNEEISNQRGLIHNKGNLAFMYYEMGNPEKAKNIYINLIPKLHEINDSINLSVVYYHLSIFCEETSQSDSTLYYLNKAMAVAENLADTSILTTLYSQIGQIFLNNNQYDSALYILTKSADLSKAIDDYITEKRALKLLLTIDSVNLDYEKAIVRYGRILILNDSIYTKRIRNNLDASELKHENQKKSNQIEIQKIDLISAHKQNQLLLFLFLFSGLMFLLLVLLSILLVRNYKKNRELLYDRLKIRELELENSKQSEEISKLRIKKIEKEIKVKDQEQLCNAIDLEQKNELLVKINKIFTEIKQDVGSVSLTELNGLVSVINKQLKDSSDTDLFNQKFNQLHHNFFDNLQQNHLNLTKTELKFCAYLRLNLNGSQVAIIQNVSQEAIRKTRYRIRKKMNLNPKDSLEDYIFQF